MCRVPCRLLSLKSKKGCDEKGRRRRNDESREPGIRNDVPGILGPEGRAGFSAFVFAFFLFFFATTQFTKVGVRLTT